MKAADPMPRLPFRRGAVEYCLGNEADHEAVYQILLHIFQGPEREGFLGALSAPGYHPSQRLLAKMDGRIVSHIQLIPRSMRFGVGGTRIPSLGMAWVGTLPEYRGLGLAQNLARLARSRAIPLDAPVLSLITSMPQFYRPMDWAVCGRRTVWKIASRTLPAAGDGLVEAKGGHWFVRPWRQVELADLMRLAEQTYGHVTGSVFRSEETWRWMIGQRRAHVIWVACQGDAVRGYAFVKDHRVLELAVDPRVPQALQVLLGRVRAEALERAYPEVHLHAPQNHPVAGLMQQFNASVFDSPEWDGQTSMYDIADPGRFLQCILPELVHRVRQRASQHDIPQNLVHVVHRKPKDKDKPARTDVLHDPDQAPQQEHDGLPASAAFLSPLTLSSSSNPYKDMVLELGIALDDRRWLIRIKNHQAVLEPDRLSRRYLTLSTPAFTRLMLGHYGIDDAVRLDGVQPSCNLALETARILFPALTLWRGPLDEFGPKS